MIWTCLFIRLLRCCNSGIADYVPVATPENKQKFSEIWTILVVLQSSKERAWNNLNNYGAGFLLLTKRSQEEHSCSTQRLRSLSQGQKDKSECSSYFMHVPYSA